MFPGTLSCLLSADQDQRRRSWGAPSDSPRTATFLARYPDIKVEFVVDTRFVDIVSDGYDAGIRVYDDVPRDMVAVRFGPDLRFAAVASPGYLAEHGMPAVPADLAHHRCIRFRFESGALYRWNLERLGSSMNIDVNGPLTLGNTKLMVEAALTGIGIAWVPDYQTAEHGLESIHVWPVLVLPSESTSTGCFEVADRSNQRVEWKWGMGMNLVS